MKIQESNNITVSDIEIKVEKFEESSSGNKSSDQIISNKFNEEEIKEEYFDVPEFIVHEDIVIKTEDQEDDQSNSKYFGLDYEESRKTFTCSYCCTGLSTEQYRIAHERRCKLRKKKQHLGENVFECAYCKLLYTRIEDKNVHQVVCKKRKEPEKYEEKNRKKGERKYCCNNCSYETEHKRYLVHHIRIHHKVNDPKYSCNQCPYQTTNNSYLKKHLRQHNGFGLICVWCEKSFKFKGNLDAHLVSRHPDRSDQWGSTVTHKINECPNCSYKTVLLSSFKKHLATHRTPPEQTLFKCNICKYTCSQNCNLIRHLRLHVGQLPFVCTECDKRFNQKVHLDSHIISRHSKNEGLVSSVTNKVHQCDKCDYKTVRNTNFKKHLKRCLRLN